MQQTNTPEVCLPAGVTRRLVSIEDGKVSILRSSGSKARLYGDRDALRARQNSGARYEVWALNWNEYAASVSQPDDSWREGLNGLAALDGETGEDLNGNCADWL